MDFVEELVVSAHISRGSCGFTGARGLSRKINNTKADAAVFSPRPSTPDGGSDLLWNLFCPLLYLLNQGLEGIEIKCQLVLAYYASIKIAC